MFLFENQFMRIALSLVIVICASSIHEYAHAWAAHKLGDDTAKEQGRLTINPLAHIDLFGSIILPFFLATSGGPVFAYARPVPYNPNRLRNPGSDDALVAIAGPISNLVQAVVGAALFRIVGPNIFYSSEPAFVLAMVLQMYVYINLILMFFNLLPMPPLDGSKLVMPLLHSEAKRKYYQIQQYALVVMLVLLYIVPTILDFDPLSLYFDATAGRLFDVLIGG